MNFLVLVISNAWRLPGMGMGLKHPHAAPMEDVPMNDMTTSEDHLLMLVSIEVRYFGRYGSDIVSLTTRVDTIVACVNNNVVV